MAQEFTRLANGRNMHGIPFQDMKKIGVLFGDTRNPFWPEMIGQYRRLAPSFGLNVVMRYAADPGEQCRELLHMAREEFDAVIVNPITGDNLLAALRGLPFPSFDVGPKCDPERTAGLAGYFPIAATDFEEQGRLAGEALVSQVEAKDEGWALILGGRRNARQSSLRCRGAFETFRKSFAQERIVTLYTGFDGGSAYRAVKAIAAKLAIQVVFCANDVMALGAAKALREDSSGLAVPIGGVDAIPEALEAIRDGRLFCTVKLPHAAVAEGVCRVVSDWLRKGVPPSREPLVRSALVLKP